MSQLPSLFLAFASPRGHSPSPSTPACLAGSGTSLNSLPVSKQVRELTDAQFPHSFLVSGKQRTLQLQAR